MLYKKIRLQFHYAKKRFERTVLVQADIDLVRLGCVFCSALGGTYEHPFTFSKGQKSYLPDAFMDDLILDPNNELPMKNYTLSDLSDKFEFTYDMGEDWRFDCKVYADVEEKNDDNQIAYLLDGKGQGIWEDNIGTLMAYLDGDIDASFSEEDPDSGLSLPWNYDVDKVGDFDTAFDLEVEQEFFADTIDFDIQNYLGNCHLMGWEKEINHIVQDQYDFDDIDDFDDFDYGNDSYIYDLFMNAADRQIEKHTYIAEKYKELEEKYDDQLAQEMITDTLIESMADMIASTDEFKDKIKNLE